jgi:hypothetical protein
MPIDIERLRSLAAFTDPEAGISERFVEVSLTSGSTIGVLSVPTGTQNPTGWVITHSFGPEHINLSALDVAIARRIAADGSPVLRFHCQGYGDSEHERFTPSIESHVQDTIDATRTLRAFADVTSIGIIGAKFGGSSALLAGSGAGADHLALIAPIVRGARFLRELVRAGAIIELTKAGHEEAPDAWSALKEGGSISVRGSIITSDHYRSFDELDLRKAPAFSGSALLLQVTTGTQPRRDVSELSERLTTQGTNVTTAIVTDQSAALLGERHFRPVGGDLLGDVSFDLHAQITKVVADWCADVPLPAEARGRGSR